MLEDAIEALTLAVNKNNDLLNAVLLKAGAFKDEQTEAPKPAKAVKAKPVVAPDPEDEDKAEVETPKPAKKAKVVEPEPEPEPEAEDETPQLTRDEWIDRITQRVRQAFAASGPGLPEKKKEFETIRAKFGVNKVTELEDDAFPKFWQAIVNL